MRVFRKDLGKAALLLLVPVGLVGLGVLMFVLIVLGNLGHSVFGPPAIWDSPRNSPARAELVGQYWEIRRELERPEPGAPATLELHADGTMRVNGLPNETCQVSGTGGWGGPEADSTVTLTVDSDGAAGSCESSEYRNTLALTGRSRPYGLYWTVDDPDSGTGVWLKRQP